MENYIFIVQQQKEENNYIYNLIIADRMQREASNKSLSLGFEPRTQPAAWISLCAYLIQATNQRLQSC